MTCDEKSLELARHFLKETEMTSRREDKLCPCGYHWEFCTRGVGCAFVTSSDAAAIKAEHPNANEIRYAIRFVAFEEAAKVCEALEIEAWNAYKRGDAPQRGNPRTEGRSDGAHECAVAIRDLKNAAPQEDIGDGSNQSAAAAPCCCSIHHPNYGRCLQCPIHGLSTPSARTEKG